MAANAPPSLEVGGRSYVWIDDWAQIPSTPARRAAFPHTGIAITDTGELVTFDQAERALLRLARDGRLLGSAPVDIDEAHGLTVVVEDGQPYVWLADASVARRPEAGYRGPELSTSSAAVKVTLEGTIAMSVPRPPGFQDATADYHPTCVAVYEERFGGSGDIWVADGYGESYVHHYNRRGDYLGRLSGEEGGGRFKTPHAVYVDRRRDEPELYIADRANGRVQVYGMDGHFRRLIDGVFSRPTWIAADGEFLIVVEFTPPRLTILDGDDRLVGYLAESPVILERPGWPNELDAAGEPRRPALKPGKFNSPHVVAVDQDGNFYVTEFLIGGRMPKLERTGG